MIRLWGRTTSINVRKVLWTLQEAGVPFERIDAGLAFGVVNDADYVAKNPNRLVPLLEDGDFVLWESNAIMQYLCTKKPGSTLYPSDPEAQCDVNRWMFWQSGHLGPAVGAIQYERMIKGMLGAGPADAAVVAAALDRFNRFAKVLDGHLEGREWIVGDGLSLADFSVGSCFVYAGPAELPMDPFANIQRWYAKLGTLPAWAAATTPGG